MCLNTKKYDKADANFILNNPFVADRDITVWKLFSNYRGEGLAAPFYPHMKYVMGNGYVSPMKYELLMWTDYKDNKNDKYYVSVGEGLHSFRTMFSLIFQRYLNGIGNWHVSNTNIPRCKIIRCTIPFGTKYFIGTNGDIVSEKLIIGTILTGEYHQTTPTPEPDYFM